MKNKTQKMKAYALVILSSLLIPNISSATPYFEVGDAGQSAATAQALGSDTTAITGNLTFDTYDVFSFLWNGGSFQADTQGSVSFDSMLSLWNSTGGLVLFNDDFPLCCQSLISTSNLLAGNYYLGITTFPFMFGANLTSMPADTHTNIDSIPYTIHISNVGTQANVPEPTSIALLVSGLLGFGFSRRKMNP